MRLSLGRLAPALLALLLALGACTQPDTAGPAAAPAEEDPAPAGPTEEEETPTLAQQWLGRPHHPAEGGAALPHPQPRGRGGPGGGPVSARGALYSSPQHAI